MTNQNTIFVIDASSYFFRAYHSGQHFVTSKNFPTGAMYVFVRMLLKFLKEYKPKYLFCVFDVKGETFRHKIYEDYKANREKMPDELEKQFFPLLEIIKSLGIKIVMKEGYEADDIIATIVKIGKEKGYNIKIISGDKDLVSLIDDDVVMIDTMRDRVYTKEEVIKKFGVPPEKMTDFLSLKGDSSDNIPGVRGIGDKAASSLLKEFESIEDIYENIDRVKREKWKKLLLEQKDSAFLSKKLVLLDNNVPLDLKIPDDGEVLPYDKEALTRLFKEYEFFSLIPEFDLEDKSEEETKIEYLAIKTEKELSSLVEELKKQKVFALDTETDALDIIGAKLVGISLCFDNKKAYYIPVCDTLLEKGLKPEKVKEMLMPVLNDRSIVKVGHNIKFDLEILEGNGFEEFFAHFDTMIASYLLNPEKFRHNLDECARFYLGKKTIKFKDVAPSGDFSLVSIDRASEYAGEDAYITYLLYEVLKERLKDANLLDLFYNLEMPLVYVLKWMELNGIGFDKNRLVELSKTVEKRLLQLEKRIYEIAGYRFNILSPKQLQEVLFVKMNIPPVKKTKTGYSTDISVLEELAGSYEIAKLIVEYRQLSKLKSTYIEVLPTLVNPKTGRIHTSYNQTVTSTGRLSSSDPNLQNIPIRTELGKLIRTAFVPADGYIFLDADYSQIELRVLAHLSEDENFLNAFKHNLDIHRKTASEIFGVPEDQVTEEMRRRAKTINFGIIYGMSAFRLAKELKISRSEANSYINNYFKRYPGIKKYFDSVVEFAKEHGYVETLMGRRRFIPAIKDKNKNVQKAAQRTAINTPIQGTAADIIKKAMIDIYEEFKKRKLKSKMVLQVHDELLFEVKNEELDEVYDLVKEKMENVIKLKVPLKVDIQTGKDWADAH